MPPFTDTSFWNLSSSFSLSVLYHCKLNLVEVYTVVWTTFAIWICQFGLRGNCDGLFFPQFSDFLDQKINAQLIDDENVVIL